MSFHIFLKVCSATFLIPRPVTQIGTFFFKMICRAVGRHEYRVKELEYVVRRGFKEMAP